MDQARLQSLVAHSIAVIAAGQAPTGAYLASPSFPVYRYSWLRDGAFIADGMSRAGEVESADAFFAWCERVVLTRSEQIERLIARHTAGEPIPNADFLHTRFTIDGADGQDEWEEFQLDGYGAWVWALVAHARRHGRALPSLEGATLSIRYATTFWEHPNYDWWEEHANRRHMSTLASIHGGTRALAGWEDLDPNDRAALTMVADRIRADVVAAARPLGYVPKWLGSRAVDASCISIATPFGLLDAEDPLMVRTVEEIERQLVHDRGVHRYAQDTYYGGGEWILLAALLGWHHAQRGRHSDARRQLDWVAAQATAADDLPEQVSGHLLFPDRFAEWLERWGPIATPLLWSHGMFLILADELGLLPTEASR